MSLVRWRPGHLILLAPPLAVLASLIGLSDIPIRVPERYVLGLSAEALSAVFLVAPVSAALAAWEGGRFRRARWHTWPHARPMFIVAVRALSPVMAVALLALGAALAVRFVRSDVVAFPDLLLLAKTAAIVVSHVLFGFAIGLNLPTTIAAPAVLIVDYAWMVLPVSLQPIWLRHLNGTWISCCAVYVDVAPQAWAAAVLVAVAIALAGLALMTFRSTVVRLSSVVAPLAVAGLIASALVSSLGPDPVQPRSSAALVCADSQPRVCVWPEHGDRLATVAPLIVRAVSAWHAAGFPTAAEYTEQRDVTAADAVPFGFAPRSRDVDVVAGLTGKFVPLIRCNPGGAPLHDPRDYARAWLLGVASLDLRQAGYPADVAAQVDAIRQQSMPLQRGWFDQRVNCQAAIGQDAP